MTKLGEYLKKRLVKRGDRAAFARRLKISEATVTRWFLGQSEPGFENCVQIADYFDVDPREIFRIAGRKDMELLYERSFPEYRRLNISEPDLYKDETHSDLHRRIQKLLERGRMDKLAAHVRLLEEEQALIESEQLFKWIFEQGPIGMTMTAPDYKFAKVNQMFCDMVGYTKEELTSMKFTDITYPDDVEQSIIAADKLFRGEKSYHRMEKRYLRKNGSVLWVSLTGCAIVDEDGYPLYAIGMSEDISERRTAENKLRESEQRYRLLFDRDKHPAYITASDGRVCDANQAAVKMLRTTADKVIGRDSASLLVHPACITLLASNNGTSKRKN